MRTHQPRCFAASAVTGAAALFLVVGCRAAAPRPEPLTTEQVIGMSEEGRSPEEIITRIKQSETIYSLRARDVWDLIERGVDDRVVDYMMETRLRELESLYRNQYYYYGYYPGPYWGFGYYHRPYYWWP